MFALLVTTLLGSGARLASAQQATSIVSIIVIEQRGRLLPIEQFETVVDMSCLGPAGGGTPVPHFHTKSRGPAIAIDLSEVPDPAPEACGFGLTETSTPGSAGIRTAQTTTEAVAAWEARTGLEPVVIGIGAVLEPDTATDPFAWITAPEQRVALAFAAAVIVAITAGGIAGLLVYRSEQRASTPAPTKAAMRAATEAIERAEISDRLSEAHRGLLAARVLPPPPVPVPDEEPDIAPFHDEGDDR